jgi:hypothetical protein
MGILDQKTRLMDSILTDEGRRQIGSGRFKPAFYSFSDASAVYSPSDTLVSGTSPNTNIATALTFEPFPLPQDQVSYQADDSGGLRVFGNNNFFNMPTGTVRVIGGKLVKGWENGTPEVLDSSAQFASLATTVLSGTTDNFRRLMILKSPDLLYTDRDQFLVSTNNVQFRINDTNTMLPGGFTNNTIEATEHLFSNRKLSQLDNFKFLPPVNRTTSEASSLTPIGDYSRAVNGNREIRTFDDLRTEFQNIVVQQGSVQATNILQRQTITFPQTSITNRIVGQMFEIGGGKITKLDVVDFGVFTVNKTTSPLFPEAVSKPLNPDNMSATTRIHVYFVGKVFLDATGSDKFVNIFSLIFQG